MKLEAMKAILARRGKRPAEEVKVDPVEMFVLHGEGNIFHLICNYSSTCGWSMPYRDGTRVSTVCQGLYSHAYTNHGVKWV